MQITWNPLSTKLRELPGTWPTKQREEYDPLFGKSDANRKAEFFEPTNRTEQMRALLRELYAPSTKQNEYENPLFATEEVEEITDPVDEYLPAAKYNYKEVSTKIQQAKNSQSAGKAVLSARRAVRDLKRKMVQNPKEAKELQIALTHAKRMEMVAKKKQHHLELEELVVITQKQDEKQNHMRQAAEDMRNAMIEAEEAKITKQQDEIFEERQELLDEMLSSAEEQGKTLSEEDLSAMLDTVNALGEEMMEQLEEAMELFEEMEIINPHMSREDFEKLQVKHRNSEARDIVKADMDYLKDTMNLLLPETVDPI